MKLQEGEVHTKEFDRAVIEEMKRKLAENTTVTNTATPMGIGRSKAEMCEAAIDTPAGNIGLCPRKSSPKGLRRICGRKFRFCPKHAKEWDSIWINALTNWAE